jgi:phospholipid transport system substrate-binding protein
MKKLIAQALLIILFSTNIYASEKGAQKFVNGFSQQILDLAKNGDDVEKTRGRIIGLVRDNIDIDWISKFVLGKYWRRANAEQRIKFKKSYEEYLIYTYGPKFQGYKGESFTVDNARKLSDEQYVVGMKIILNDKTPLVLSVLVLQKGEVYNIVDIAGEGISFAATQRSEFGSVVANSGVDGLLERLGAKVIQLKSEFGVAAK